MRKLKPQEVRVHRAQWNKLGGEGQSEEGQSSRGMRERERGQKVGRVPWRSKMKGEVTLDQDALRQDGVKCQSTGRATKVCRGGIMWKPPEVPIGFRMFGGDTDGEAGTCPQCSEWHPGQQKECKRLSGHDLSYGKF